MLQAGQALITFSTNKNECECEVYTVAECPPAQVHIYFDLLCVYTLQKIFAQFRCECKLEIFGAETITNCLASRKYFTIKR